MRAEKKTLFQIRLIFLLRAEKSRIRCMKHWQIPLITFAALFVSLALAEDFKTTNGKEYKNATVMLVEPDGITLRSKSGVSKVYFNKLPKEVQERFHYDPQKAAAASAEQAASNQQANQQVEESNKQRKEAEQPKARQNRVSEVQQQDERFVEQVRQAEIRTAGQKAASRADIQRFEDEAREERLGQPPVRDEVWIKGGRICSTHKDSDNTRGEDCSNSTPLKLKQGSSTTVP